MKKQSFLIIVGVLVIVAALCSFFGCNSKGKYQNETIVYSSTYSEVKLSTSETKWRDGMVGGNGRIGFLTNGSPTSDVITYQNIDFLMPTNANRDDIPSASTTLDQLRQKIIAKNAPTDVDVINNWQRIAKYHPGMQLRIDTSYSGELENYQRFTNYETAEVGEEYSYSGVSWTRKTFTSRVDDATITSITNSAKDVSLTISIDTISKMAGFGQGRDCDQTDETNIQYKELVSDDASCLIQVAHYPDFSNSSLKEGGFASVTYIIIDGGTKTAKKDSSTDTYNKSGYDASVVIKNAKAVYLITALDRTKTLCPMSGFEYLVTSALDDSLTKIVKTTGDKYTSGTFSYDDALAPSAAIQKELFNKATLTVVEKGDSQLGLTNEELIAEQGTAKDLSDVLSNRVYNQGRYAMICCAGYSMSRLSGMWIGTWDPGWRYI